MSRIKIAAPEFGLDVPRLLHQFEGLGHNCDFGMVQRAVGIEPFSLFRFGGCSAVDMGSLLQTSFQHLGEPEDLWLEESPVDREYMVKSRQYSSFLAHTKRFGGRDDPNVVLSAQIEATRFLKKKLIRELSLDRRLFVYKGGANSSAIREIATQLQTYGNNRLLWVSLADPAHLPGSVECLSDELLRGFVSRFGSYEPTPSFPVEEWIAVCAKAHRLWREADLLKAPLKNLISEAMAARRCRWSAGPCAATRLLDELAPTGGAMIEHRLGTSKSTPVYRVRVPVASGGTFAFSAWVLIPEGFRGQLIAARLPGCSIVSRWNADPKSHGQWQRLWVAATLPVDARSISCALSVEGAVGQVFHSASWCLERPTGPWAMLSPHGRPRLIRRPNRSAFQTERKNALSLVRFRVPPNFRILRKRLRQRTNQINNCDE